MTRNNARPISSHTALKTLTKSMLAISLSIAGVAHASEYSSVTFFGDSLTDGGYFSPITQGTLRLAESGQFTTNPDNVWATSFAEQLGTTAVANTFGSPQTGNNYAIGGARAGVDVVNNGFGIPITIASANTQVNNYLANNEVDSNGLYVVWAGANDLLAASQDPANAQNIVGAAVGSQIVTIRTLKDNGANYILVPNIPDIGLTPNSIDGGAVIQGQSTFITNQYNQAMLSSVAATGANIIPLDLFSLTRQINVNPAAFGFTNVTDRACGTTSSLLCGSATLVEPNADDTYFFADGIHPTGRTHQLVADYANAVVTAPSQIGVLPHIATKVGLATNERLQSHVNQVQNNEQKVARTVWATGEIGNEDIVGFESDSNAQVLVGVDFANADLGSLTNAVTGLYANITRKDFDRSSNSSGLSDIGIDEIGFGVYHTTTLEQLGGVQLNGAIGYGSMDVDVTRSVNLGGNIQNFDSDADGSRLYANLQAGYPMQMSSINLTPYLGATVNRVKIDALEEQELSGTAMQFDEQKYTTTYGKIGVKANHSLVENLNIFGDLQYQKRLSDDRDAVSARLNTVQNISFNTPTIETDDDNFAMTLGLSRSFGLLNANAGITRSQGNDDKSTSFFVGLSGAF
jgi:outer membrane lipase/esterase